MIYIVDFSSLQVKLVNFDHSFSLVLYSTTTTTALKVNISVGVFVIIPCGRMGVVTGYYSDKLSSLALSYYLLKSTWSYENRVSKHFVIFLNFPCLIACLLCCLLMLLLLLLFFFLACLVVRDWCPFPHSLFFPYPQFFL